MIQHKAMKKNKEEENENGAILAILFKSIDFMYYYTFWLCVFFQHCTVTITTVIEIDLYPTSEKSY